MNMFDPLRPLTASGQPRLLLDDGYVPHVTLSFRQDGKVNLSVMLRQYANSAHRNYSYRFYDLAPEELPTFAAAYVNDPEAALKQYFGWEPQRQTSPVAKSPQAPTGVDMFDLI